MHFHLYLVFVGQMVRVYTRFISGHVILQISTKCFSGHVILQISTRFFSGHMILLIIFHFKQCEITVIIVAKVYCIGTRRQIISELGKS